MGAAKHAPALFHAVPQNATVAVCARWRKRLNGALETVEGVLGALHADLESLVVIVPADFTSMVRHRIFLCTPFP